MFLDMWAPSFTEVQQSNSGHQNSVDIVCTFESYEELISKETNTQVTKAIFIIIELQSWKGISQVFYLVHFPANGNQQLRYPWDRTLHGKSLMKDSLWPSKAVRFIIQQSLLQEVLPNV